MYISVGTTGDRSLFHKGYGTQDTQLQTSSLCYSDLHIYIHIQVRLLVLSIAAEEFYTIDF